MEGLEVDQGAGTNTVVSETPGGEARSVRVDELEGVGERGRRGNAGVEQIEKGFLEVDVRGFGAVLTGRGWDRTGGS